MKSITESRCVVRAPPLLSNFSYMWLDKNTVIMTYTGTQDATCDGKKQGEKFVATSIWQKKVQMVVAIPPGNADGGWHVALFVAREWPTETRMVHPFLISNNISNNSSRGCATNFPRFFGERVGR